MSEKSINTAIEKYLEKGFGSMNKNDFEVYIFSELLESKYNNSSDVEISIDLKIPVSKVSRLRYEANLKYIKFDYKTELEKLLKISKPRISGQNVKFMIQVENRLLREHISNTLKQGGRISDSSFNSEIVSIAYEDLLWLVEKEYPQKYDDFVDKIKTELNKNNIKIDQTDKQSILNKFSEYIKEHKELFFLGADILSNIFK